MLISIVDAVLAACACLTFYVFCVPNPPPRFADEEDIEQSLDNPRYNHVTTTIINTYGRIGAFVNRVLPSCLQVPEEQAFSRGALTAVIPVFGFYNRATSVIFWLVISGCAYLNVSPLSFLLWYFITAPLVLHVILCLADIASRLLSPNRPWHH